MPLTQIRRSSAPAAGFHNIPPSSVLPCNAVILMLGLLPAFFAANPTAHAALTFGSLNPVQLGVVVEPQQYYLVTNRSAFTSPQSLTFVIDDAAQTDGPEYTAPHQLQQIFLQRDPQFTSTIVKASQWNGQGPAIIIAPANKLPSSIHSNQDWIDTYTKLGALYAADGCRMLIESNLVVIAGVDSRGTFYGAQTFRSLLTNNATLNAMVVRDWPDLPLRAALTQQTTSMTDPESRYDQLAYHHFNAFLLDGPMWYNLGDSANRATVQQWINWCGKYYLDPIPHIELLGHGSEILKSNPAAVEGFIAIDEITLTTTDYTLQCRNVIDQANGPILVQSLDGNTTYQAGTDYAITAGTLAYGYSASNTPWKIKAIAGRPTDGQRVKITYNYAAPNSTSYCPAEPQALALADSAINAAMDLAQPKYIHLGHDEIQVVGHDARCRATGLSNAQWVANEIVHLRSIVKTKDADCQVMIWADDMDLHHNAAGIDTEYLMDLLRIEAQDLILCHWWYQPGELTWMDANMTHSTSRSFNSMGTVWNNDQNAYEWTRQTLKKYTTGYNWGGLSRGVILGAWGGGVGDPWAAMPVTGAFAWANRNSPPSLPVAQKNREITQLTGIAPVGTSLHIPFDEDFNALDSGSLPTGWQRLFSPNAASIQHFAPPSGRGFEVSGDDLTKSEHGAKMYFDNTYCTGYIVTSQQVYIDSATAGVNIPYFFQMLDPGLINGRASLKIFKDAGGNFIIQRAIASGPVTISGVLFPTDRWVRLDMLVNIDQTRWSAWLNDNGTPVTLFTDQPYSFYPAGTGRDLAGARWLTNTGLSSLNRMWVDDVKLSYCPSPQILLNFNGNLDDSGSTGLGNIIFDIYSLNEFVSTHATETLQQSVLFSPTADNDSTVGISLPNDPALDVDSFTITAWLRPQSTGKLGLGMGLYDKFSTANPNSGICATYSFSGGKLRFLLQVNGTSAYTNTTAQTVATGGAAPWIFTAITYDAQTRTTTAYFGDVATSVYATTPVVLAGTGALHPTSNNADATIGFRASTGNRALDGNLDDFRLFRRALTRDELEAVRRCAIP